MVVLTIEGLKIYFIAIKFIIQKYAIDTVLYVIRKYFIEYIDILRAIAHVFACLVFDATVVHYT